MGVNGDAGFTDIFSFFLLLSSPGERSIVALSSPSLVLLLLLFSSQHFAISLSSIVSKCSVLAKVICSNTDGHRRGPLINVGSPSSSSSSSVLVFLVVVVAVDVLLLLLFEYVSSS